MLPEAIKDIKQIYKDEENKELSDSEALEMGNNLLALFNILSKPLSGEEIKELKKIKLCQQKKK
jgi:hypothetical protein